MAFLDKVGKLAKAAAEKTGDAVEVGKLTVKIRSEKGKIEDCMQSIGAYYYDQYKNGAELPAEVAAFCSEISEREATIAALEEEKAAVGADVEEEPAEAAAEEVSAEEVPAEE